MGKRKIVCLILVISIVAASLSSCVESLRLKALFSELFPYDSAESELDSGTAVPESTDSENDYTDDRSALYAQIYTELSSYSESVTLKCRDEETARAVYDEVIDSSPELFWLNKDYTYITKTRLSGVQITIKQPLPLPVETLTEQSKALEAVAKEIETALAEEPDSYSKLLYIHDYLVDNTRYDMEEYDKMVGGAEEYFTSQNAYGCLVDREAVCTGYSAAFRLLASREGIECGYVTGKGLDGEAHMWNYVSSGGDYYYVDATWDDPVSDDGEESKMHDYFMIDEKELLLTHTIDKEQFVPECNSISENYYVKNGTYLETYTYEGYKAIADMADGDVIEVKFGSPEELEKAKEDLMTNSRIFDAVYVPNSISYNSGMSGTVLTVTVY